MVLARLSALGWRGEVTATAPNKSNGAYNRWLLARHRRSATGLQANLKEIAYICIQENINKGTNVDYVFSRCYIRIKIKIKYNVTMNNK